MIQKAIIDLLAEPYKPFGMCSGRGCSDIVRRLVIPEKWSSCITDQIRELPKSAKYRGLLECI